MAKADPPGIQTKIQKNGSHPFIIWYFKPSHKNWALTSFSRMTQKAYLQNTNYSQNQIIQMGQLMNSADADMYRSTRLKAISNQNQINSKRFIWRFWRMPTQTGRLR